MALDLDLDLDLLYYYFNLLILHYFSTWAHFLFDCFDWALSSLTGVLLFISGAILSCNIIFIFSRRFFSGPISSTVVQCLLQWSSVFSSVRMSSWSCQNNNTPSQRIRHSSSASSSQSTTAWSSWQHHHQQQHHQHSQQQHHHHQWQLE